MKSVKPAPKSTSSVDVGGSLDYAMRGIRHVIDTFGKRDPGSEGEIKAQEYFAGELKQWADEVVTQKFDLHPNSFMGWMPIASSFGIISVLLPVFSQNIASKTICFALVSLALFLFIMQLLRYVHVTAFLFPKKTSANVYASRKPSGEVKRRIIFDGHTDAAFEWRFSYIGGWALKIMIIGAVSGLLFLFAVSVLNLFGLFGPAAQRALGYIQLIFLPVFAGMLFFIRWDIVVDGANDNLTANYTAMTVIKEMAEKDFRYENTEVCVLLTGSEEAGLRGAKAFAEMNKELTNEVETVIIGLETLHDMDHLAVQLVDLTGTVKNDARVGKLIKEAALKCGMDLPYGGFFPGATNPAAYTQAGIPAASLCGVNHDPQKYYHTREDNFESLNPECIEASMQISIECANLYDEAGGIDKFR